MDRAKAFDAIDYYHELLAGDYLASTVEALDAATARWNLRFGSRPVCTVLRPYFITEAQYEAVGRASSLVMRGIAALSKQLAADSQLRAELDLTPEEEAISLIATGYGAPDVSARLDGFLSPDGEFNFVEYNAESPGGLAYGDALGIAFSEMPILQAFARRFDYRALPVRDMVFNALMSAYRGWGGGELPNIAIIDWRGVSTYSEFLLMKERFESYGCRVKIADPDELEYRDGQLFIEEFKVDLVYKRVVIAELLAKLGLDHTLVRAVRDRAVCMANGFGVQMLNKKAIFALLSDTSFSHLFDADVSAALARHIPWTRKVREAKTDYRGMKVDLVEFILNNRERLVLKPNGEYGGKGVALGWECDESAWSSVLREALATSYIVQERVPLGEEVFPSIVDGKPSFDNRYLDLDPYVWGGERVEGCGVRLSSLQLLNVTAGGGSATPMFIIKAR